MSESGADQEAATEVVSSSRREREKSLAKYMWTLCAGEKAKQCKTARPTRQAVGTSGIRNSPGEFTSIDA